MLSHREFIDILSTQDEFVEGQDQWARFEFNRRFIPANSFFLELEQAWPYTDLLKDRLGGFVTKTQAYKMYLYCNADTDCERWWAKTHDGFLERVEAPIRGARVNFSHSHPVFQFDEEDEVEPEKITWCAENNKIVAEFFVRDAAAVAASLFSVLHRQGFIVDSQEN
jgi:hypothetical protein